jgi:hypothetical protein
MITRPRLLLLSFLLLASFAFADTVILRDGDSYTGHLQGFPNNQVGFTDNSGVQYKFPAADVQTLVFTQSSDTITLRNGKTYSGHYTGPAPVPFQDNEGIDYRFPKNDIASVVFTGAPAKPQHQANDLVIPFGTEVSVRNDRTIDSDNSSTGELHDATIAMDVLDSAGGVAIPRGAPAKLVVRNIKGGGAVHTPELVLDLFYVIIKGKEYRVVSSDVDYAGRHGLGANRRTAEFAGGGAAFGALMGAVFGGGKGAAIGAGSGAAAGALTQLFTRGKKIKVPAETELTFRLERTLVLRPS